MDAVIFFFILFNVLFVIFAWRIWQFLARHPLIKLLDDVAWRVDVIKENEQGEPAAMETIHVRLTRTQ